MGTPATVAPSPAPPKQGNRPRDVALLIAVILLPGVLGALEWLVRHGNHETSNEFFAPSLAAAGVALFLPMVSADGLDPATPKRNGVIWFVVFSSIILTAAGLGVWGGILYDSIYHDFPDWLPEWHFGGHTASFCLAVVYYLVGIVFSFLKILVKQ
ncbi:hypothetical protein [Burkholderia cepacia]|uniref:hypothetical protein n=1 Tax=Burkholderia cepacia TaxID=292 RepID=UPI00158C0BC9|nr:hypothetical protein [Burkholderia cepacia]